MQMRRRCFQRKKTWPLGIDRENVVILINNPILQTRFDAFKNELLTKPGIKYVTCAAQGPTDIGQSISIDWEGNPDEDMLGIDYTVVDYDFFKPSTWRSPKEGVFHGNSRQI